MVQNKSHYRTPAEPRDIKLAKEYATRLRKRLGDNLLSVTLFGSRARGDAKPGSDFDLIVRVRSCSAEVRETVLTLDVQMMDEFDELFVGMLYDEAEWKMENEMPLGWNIAREGVPL